MHLVGGYIFHPSSFGWPPSSWNMGSITRWLNTRAGRHFSRQTDNPGILPEGTFTMNKVLLQVLLCTEYTVCVNVALWLRVAWVQSNSWANVKIICVLHAKGSIDDWATHNVEDHLEDREAIDVRSTGVQTMTISGWEGIVGTDPESEVGVVSLTHGDRYVLYAPTDTNLCLDRVWCRNCASTYMITVHDHPRSWSEQSLDMMHASCMRKQ